jgi:crotonobetainyl-CoA:carnitine CoA-transferase CaiB-like acyl-CoA transferase
MSPTTGFLQTSAAIAACAELLTHMGVDPAAGGGTVSITGDDPVSDSRFRPGAAVAAALAAQGTAIAAIWRSRSGNGQDVAVDLQRAAVVGLRTSRNIYQNGTHHEDLPRATVRFPDFFRTRDGRQIYILRSLAHPEPLIRMLTLLDCVHTPEAMAKAIGKWDALELEDRIASERLIGVIARPRDEWRSHPQGAWLDSRPVIEIEKIGESEPEPFAPAARPLSGIRVLDMTHVLAGPSAARTLAEQGAEVLHISALHQMDTMRVGIDTGLGKRQAFLDIDRPEQLGQLKALAGDADIFVQSWRPGSLDKRGLSPQELAAARPGLIYVSVSCYGSDGPWRSRAGYEPCGQAASGLVIDDGSPDQPRFAAVRTLNDYLTAYLAAAGTLGALVRRASEGGSYHVKVSLTRSSMWVQDLGQLAPDQWPSKPPSLKARPEHLMQMDSRFGRLTVPAPVTQYSRTPAYWSRAPEPFGASPARWEDSAE